MLADIYEDCSVDIARIKMAGEPLLLIHEKYFIEQFEEDLLKEEVCSQYEAWCRVSEEDRQIENNEIKNDWM